jgi:Fe-S-cluster containining protein
VGQSGILGMMSLPAGDSELVQIVDAALVDAARRAGAWLVCRPGCTQCCHGAFVIGPLDALRLEAGMHALRAEQQELSEQVQRRASAWISEHSAAFPGDARTGLLGDSDEDRQRFEEFANEAACPALDPVTGRCDVYAWRPMTCRVFGPPVRMGEGEALGHCELCFAGASAEDVAACEMPVAHEAEAKLLQEIEQKGETVVAFALLR